MFAQTPAIPTPLGPFIILSEVDSTNNYAMAKLHAGMLQHGTTLLAIFQSAGKGQRGKQWYSGSGENITMSTVYSLPHSLSPSYLLKLQSFPFLLSASVALGCYDFIKAFSIADITIKWPNDIYIGDRKAGGILIENIYRSNEWMWAIAGIGINLNQQDFSGLINPATSLSSITGKSYNLHQCGRSLQRSVEGRFNAFEHTSESAIVAEYNSILYKRGEKVKLRKQNTLFSTTINQVTIDGELVTTDSMEHRFKWGEVEFVTE